MCVRVCVCGCVCVASHVSFLFDLWISVMSSELDEIAAGFSLLCLVYVFVRRAGDEYGVLTSVRVLDLSVNALGSEVNTLTHIDTQAHTPTHTPECFFLPLKVHT